MPETPDLVDHYRRHQQAILTGLVRVLNAIILAGALANTYRYLQGDRRTTLVQQLLAALWVGAGWWCLVTIRRGRITRAARGYLATAMLIAAAIVFVLDDQYIMIGAMGLLVLVLVAAFVDAPSLALLWGGAGTLLYATALTVHVLWPIHNPPPPAQVLPGLYLFPAVSIFGVALFGRRSAGALYNALVESEAKRDDLLSANATLQAEMQQRERLEQQGQEREAFLQMLIENQGEGIAMVDPQERFTFANPAAESIFGVPPGTLVGRSVTDFTDEAGSASIQDQTTRRQTGVKSTYQHDIIRPDGQRRQLLVTATPRFDADHQFLGTFGVFRDDTERAELQEELQVAHHQLDQRVQERTAELAQANQSLQRRNRELSILNRAAQAFGSVLDLDEVLALVLDQVRDLLNVSATSIWLVDDDRQHLICYHATGTESDQVLGWKLPVGTGIVGWVFENVRPLVVEDARLDERHSKRIDRATGIELRSILAIPLQAKGQAIGVLEVLDVKPGRFEEQDVASLELLAVSAAAAVENARLVQDLERARQRWEEIFQAIGHPTLILDPDYRILSANRAAVETTGNQVEALLGETCFQVYHNSSDCVARCPLERLRSSGSAEPVEMEMQALGGVFLVSCTPVLDERDQLREIIHIATNITSLKETEASLKESQTALERRNQALAIANQVAAAISQAVNLDGMLTRALTEVVELTEGNVGWVMMLAPEEERLSLAASRGLGARTTQQLTELGQDPAWAGALISMAQSTAVIALDKDPRISLSGLDLSPAEAVVVVPVQARERIFGVLCIALQSQAELDVYGMSLYRGIGRQIGVAAENLELIEQSSEIEVLRQADRLRSELIANASHELRTPLGLIKIFASTLLLDEVDLALEKRREFLAAIEEETANLEGIVDNLLDLGRMESHRLRLDRHLVDLVDLVEKATSAMQPELDRHQLLNKLPQASVMALVDPVRIRQVLRNLLSNAIKYSPQGGTITVQLGTSGDHVQICVSDEGIGIPKSEQERIFERFYRVQNEHTSQVRGVGLGLAICRWIVGAHGGQITVDSAPGRGSTFCLSLPADGEIQR
jgi:PAS domain S-box-containing protein